MGNLYMGSERITPAFYSEGGSSGGEKIWAKNQLNFVSSGDKVWISPISNTTSKIYEWPSTPSYSDWKRISLCSLNGIDTCLRLCVEPQNGSASETTYYFGQLVSFDINTGSTENIYNNYVTRGNYSSITFIKHPTPYFDEIWYNKSNSSGSLSYVQQNSTSVLNIARRYVSNGKGFNFSPESGRYVLHVNEINDDGSIGAEIGYDNQQYPYNGIKPVYIYSNGDLIACKGDTATGVFKYTLNNGSYTKGTEITLNDGIEPSDLYSTLFLGFTTDGKYMLKMDYYFYAGGTRALTVYEFDHQNNSISLYTGLGISDQDACGFYPCSNTLVSWNPTENTIRMWKYDTVNGFVEKTLDFGNITFTNIQRPEGVTLNYDCSMICINCGSNGVYLFSLEQSGNNTYRAIPYNRYNFSSISFTGILTGNVNQENNTVEVKTLLS